MAALARLRYIQPVAKRVFSPVISNRLISTSKKNSDTVTAADTHDAKCDKPETKNWVSYGFDFRNQQEDENVMHGTTFFTVTCCIVLGGFLWAYMPDMQYRDWAQRQAFLEIRRREQEGLPHVDRNFVDPSSIALPSDEELGDTEIII